MAVARSRPTPGRGGATGRVSLAASCSGAVPGGGMASAASLKLPQVVLVDHRASSSAADRPTGSERGDAVVRQAATGLVQAGLHRSRPPADRSGDLPLGQAGPVAQHGGDAQVLGQGGEGVEDRVGGRGHRGRRLGGVERPGCAGPRPRGALPAWDLLAEVGVAGVDEHPVHPGLDALAVGQSAAEAPHPEERLLHRLLRVGGVADDECAVRYARPYPATSRSARSAGPPRTSWLY